MSKDDLTTQSLRGKRGSKCQKGAIDLKKCAAYIFRKRWAWCTLKNNNPKFAQEDKSSVQMTCKKCIWNRQGDSQKKHVKFLWFYFLQECDFITPTMRKLRGSILLSVQGHEKLWVFWKGTIVEPISFFWRTRGFIRSWRFTECGSNWEVFSLDLGKCPPVAVAKIGCTRYRWKTWILGGLWWPMWRGGENQSRP